MTKRSLHLDGILHKPRLWRFWNLLDSYFHGWEFIPRPATILTKKREMDFHFTQLPILTITSNHILHKFEVTLDKKNHRERPHFNNRKIKKKRGHSYNDSVDPTWTNKTCINMKMPDSRWTRRSINISTTRPSQKRDKTKCIYLQYPSKRKLISTCKQENPQHFHLQMSGG